MKLLLYSAIVVILNVQCLKNRQEIINDFRLGKISKVRFA